MKDVIEHYNKLIEEENDPVHDPKPLKDYMEKKQMLLYNTQLIKDYISKQLSV